MKTFLTTSILSLFIVLGACSKTADKDEPATKEQPSKTEAAGHAAKDVVPGSYEDWCEEHQVPESQCTQCDPKLAAAFKATDDWCEEHGLPKSHDRKHYPDLKLERPAKK
jgi:hypothetical protein